MLAVLCLYGCAKVDDNVFLGVRMVDEPLDHITNTTAYTDTGLRVFINGNFCTYLRSGGMGGPVDQFLKPGGNILEVDGSTVSPVEITLGSFTADHKPLRTIFRHTWPCDPTGYVKKVGFSVNKEIKFPVFNKNYAMPDQNTSERQILAVVSNLYFACATSNKAEFLRLSMEGSEIHSPTKCDSLRASIGSMFENLQVGTFPSRLQFIHGKTLIFVHSTSTGYSNSMTLFEPRTTNSCSIAGVSFAFVQGRWIVW